MALRFRSIERIVELKRMADINLLHAQRRYELDHDKKDQFGQIFALGNYVIVKHLPLPTTTAKRFTSENYSRLCPRLLGPYRLVSVGPEVVPIMKDRIKNTVSKNRVTRTAQPDGSTEIIGKRSKNKDDDPLNEQEWSTLALMKVTSMLSIIPSAASRHLR